MSLSTMHGDGRLIPLHRMSGVPTRDVAAEEGKVAATIRQNRNRAEDASADMTVS